MEYPKQLMTITELANMGFNRKFLYKLVHVKGCPVIRETPKSQWKFDTSRLDRFLEYKNIKKRDVQ